ncbi:MAG: LUD domain-containing protein [Terracidiphilus sp.]
MNSPSSAQMVVLDRVRAAIAGIPAEPDAHPHPGYIRRGELDRHACLELMIERLREYNADVVECMPPDLPDCIEATLRASAHRTFLAPPGLPSDWRVSGFNWKIDTHLSYAEIEACDGVVTAAFAGIADSGTIVLHHSAAEGRRVLTLLPDWHLCILRTSQVVETLPEYFDRCPQPPALATYISGPSATADIEMTRIKGVHGPRFLNVLLVHDDAPGLRSTRNGDLG